MSSTRFPAPVTAILALLVQLSAVTGVVARDWIPYVTPGIKFGWDFQKGFTMGPKLGIGLVDLDHGKYINVTIGIKAFEKSSGNGNQFVFLDCQIGAMVPDASLLSVGGGAGLLLGKGNGGLKVAPRSTLFCGFIAFAGIDFNFWGADEISLEPGMEIGLAVPLKKNDVGFD